MQNKLGSLIISVEGLELTAEDREMLAHPLVGGLVLFARNFHSLNQLKALCHDIHSVREHPLIIMVDQEGGRVQRFIEGFTRLPYMAEFGKLHSKHPETAKTLAHDCGWLMASELLAAGVDLSLAPVLDLNKGVSTIIGDRAFAADPDTVITLASAFIAGMNKAGMASVGKHFPGHGSVVLDSHIALPKDDRSLAELIQDDMLPFTALIKQGVTGLMAAHIIFSQVDTLPVGFSRRWLQDILRTQLGFKGPIFTDDLDMEGANISSHYSDRFIAAREAGCDFALVCNNRPGAIQVLDHLPYSSHMVDKEKWGALTGKFDRVSKPLAQNAKWQETQEKLLSYVQ